MVVEFSKWWPMYVWLYKEILVAEDETPFHSRPPDERLMYLIQNISW